MRNEYSSPPEGLFRDMDDESPSMPVHVGPEGRSSNPPNNTHGVGRTHPDADHPLSAAEIDSLLAQGRSFRPQPLEVKDGVAQYRGVQTVGQLEEVMGQSLTGWMRGPVRKFVVGYKRGDGVVRGTVIHSEGLPGVTLRNLNDIFNREGFESMKTWVDAGVKGLGYEHESKPHPVNPYSHDDEALLVAIDSYPYGYEVTPNGVHLVQVL